MQGRVVILGQTGGREAAALLVDGHLEDLLIEAGEDSPPEPGVIFRGTVDRQMKGQGGVFVRLGNGLKGFLRETSGLAPGQNVIVMVTGHAEPGKAVPVSLRCLFKSRLAIVTPGAEGVNISRRIRDVELRETLQSVADAAMEGSDFGLILRSAAMLAEDDEIAEDIAAMRELAEAVMADLSGGPELLLDAPAPHEAAWRDWAEPAPDEVIEAETAFADHGVEEWIDALMAAEVKLVHGGTMIIEPTRALIAVDVNTGADTSPAAALKANIATARVLPRELRLRGLGGQVVVDFAPMPKRDRPAVEQQLRSSFRAEGGEASLAGWTQGGLYEIQRKRERASLAEVLKGVDR